MLKVAKAICIAAGTAFAELPKLKSPRDIDKARQDLIKTFDRLKLERASYSARSLGPRVETLRLRADDIRSAVAEEIRRAESERKKLLRGKGILRDIVFYLRLI